MKETGQAVLLILLAMSVILTLVLSVISRSVTDVVITTNEEESLRAFSAAESGIERNLTSYGAIFQGSGDFGEGTQIEGTVSRIAENITEFNYPGEVASGESATLWFVSHDENGDLICSSPTSPCFTGNSIRVCWGDNALDPPALEASIFYDPDADGVFDDLAVARVTADPDSIRGTDNNFSAASNCSSAVNGETYLYETTINFSSLSIPSYTLENGLQLARFKLLYADTAQPIAVEAFGSTFPSQGRIIESIGISGESQRKIKVTQLYPDAPAVFDFTLFNYSGSITK